MATVMSYESLTTIYQFDANPAEFVITPKQKKFGTRERPIPKKTNRCPPSSRRFERTRGDEKFDVGKHIQF